MDTKTTDKTDWAAIDSTAADFLKGRRIILASGSPRRSEMFQKRGFSPVIAPAEVDETLPQGIGPKDAVAFLALKKGLWAEKQEISLPSSPAQTPAKSPLIISADTVVYLHTILGKPRDESEAFHMLQMLRNKTHYVATGVSMILAGARCKRIFCEVTKVFFQDYSDQEIQDYIATREPMDKAGAYGIQGKGALLVQGIRGDYYNVVGLPVARVARILRTFAV